MASASSSSFFSEFKIQDDVFIHFCGEDIRRNFVSHLSSALLQAGVKASLIDAAFLESIERFQIGIVVFTKEYSESSRCSDGLVKIIKCHKTHGLMVMPVFYEIDPSDGGIYMGKKTSSQRWRRALTKAANLPTWDGSKHRNDAELVEEIVQSVLAKLECPLSMTKFPVGLEPHVKHVIGLFENRPITTSIIGIWGMGGSGKTTVAKAVYNQILYRFRHKSFIQDIRQVCEIDDRGLVHLQEQLLSDVLKTNVKLESGGMEETMMENRLFAKKLFIVLDDVNEIDQSKHLCGNGKWFGEGSVIIITTTNLDLLYQLNVDYVYEMDKMDENYSVELFSWHAFREAKPREDFNELARYAVAYCGGLPLALEVLGSYLRKRSENEWRSVLSKLEVIPNTQVQNKLRISFDGLCETEKEIFLDVCCFFIGKERGYVTEILNGCGLHADIGIAILIERGLIKIVKNNKLGMHNLLRDMGREIVRQSSTMQPGERSRLWLPKDVLDVLTENTGTQAIEGLSLNCQSKSSYLFEGYAFEKMKKLRFLQLDHVQLIGDYGYLSKQLRWIYWQGFPLEDIPNNFYLEGAIVMDFQHSYLRLVWKEPKVLPLLKILNLSHSKYLIETPDFSKLPSLEKLILKHCPRLRKVHQSIGDLHNLLLINLKGCTNLSNLPSETYKLKSLKTLILSGCLKIAIFKEDILHMKSLTTLISEKIAVKQVPISVVSSKSIAYILLDGNKGLSPTVFRSIIWSWMSRTINPLSRIRPFRGTSSSLVSINIRNNVLGDLAPVIRSIINLRNLLVQCVTEYQTLQVRTILEEVCVESLITLKIRPSTPEISKHPLKPYLIEFGGYLEKVLNPFREGLSEVLRQCIFQLRKSIFEGLATSESCDVFPSDCPPYRLAYMNEGPSVRFTVPDNFHMEGMILGVVYLSTLENTTTECLISVLIVNYTKRTIQLFNGDTTNSFNDVDWQGLISHMGRGDKVEILVNFGDGFVVQKTAVYQLYDGSIDEKVVVTSPNNMEVKSNSDLEKVRVAGSVGQIDDKESVRGGKTGAQSSRYEGTASK